ncbi:IBR finger domain protein [Podospora aff. communis PSN243]|uniref:IBR finger domain protein n=1 Tax=Podospora aff. communis PSN243 TaxID=3040156 RepID=A0AAV9G514_9PEZI|nr:IBR finger domain protein [Podospora aff. communis PSN243]
MTSPQRTVLITGCSDGGCGSALALAFHKSRWRVFASARNPSKLRVVQAAGIETLPLDITSPSSITAAASHISSLTSGTLTCLVHNAASGFTMPLVDVDIPAAKSLFDTNVFSIISVTQAFLPLLRNAAPDAVLVIHTSLSSQCTGMAPFAGVYNASKAAAAALAETFRSELAPLGIRTVNILTGVVKTNFGPNRAVEGKLPEGSIYAVAREEAQRVMDNTVIADGWTPERWAEKVVGELSVRRPKYWIWAGPLSTFVWLAGFLPVGMMDFVLKRVSGLGELERRMGEVMGGKGK